MAAKKRVKKAARKSPKSTKSSAKRAATKVVKKAKAVAKKARPVAKKAPKRTTAGKAVKKAAAKVVKQAKTTAKQLVKTVEKATAAVKKAARQARAKVREAVQPSAPGVSPDEDPYASARLVHHDGRSSLVFSEWDAARPVFEARGRLGNGYDWAGVVAYLVEKHAPALAGQLSYDPEAGMFAVASKSEEALSQVSGLIRRAMSDERMLADAIDNTEVD